MNIVTLSSNNQIAIPSYLLRDLNFGPGDKLVVRRMGDSIGLDPIKGSVIKGLSGSLKKYIPKNKLNTPWKKVILEARKAMAYAAANN